MPLVYIAAWRMLVTNAVLKPGEYVLILGIGGGVAIAALQIGPAGSPYYRHVEQRRQTSEGQDIGSGLWHQLSQHGLPQGGKTDYGKRGVDVAVNCIGGDTWAKSLASLAKGGRLVSCGAVAGPNPQTDIGRIFWNHLRVFGSALGTRWEFIQLLNPMKGAPIKPVIDQVLPLSEAGFGHRRLEEGKQFGKIVLRPDA